MTTPLTRRVAIPIIDLNRALQTRAAEQEAYGAAVAGLVTELELAGFHISRLRELKRPTVGRESATPILSNWLSEASLEPLRCDIADVLGSKWAQPEGAAALIAEYWKITAERRGAAGRLIAAICTSLERIADDDVVLFALLGLMKLDAGDEAIRRVALLTGHRNPVVRKTAQRAVRRWREFDVQPHSGPGW